MAKRTRKSCSCNANSTVYTASAWWDQSDPSMQAVAITARKAKAAIGKMIREAARSARDDESYRTIREAEGDLHWSGVHTFRLSDLANARELPGAIQDLNDGGIWYPETP